MVRTRFAPSPTGFLHMGGLRTALYDYLLAKQNKGDFILRIEDTDRKRLVDGGILNIVESLVWVGLKPDVGVVIDGDHSFKQVGESGPYIQSERLHVYQGYIQQLLKNGHAYYCFCSQERLTELRRRQQEKKELLGYDGYCRELTIEEAERRIAKGEQKVVRMKMPKDGETDFVDLIHGRISVKNNLCDDQVILKSDGYPTYHLAVVVDDHEMKITHVIRGEEWIPSTPKHLQLYKYLGWEAPLFIHLPLLLNSDRSKLSKRQGDVSVSDYIKKGYLPEAIINFVALLGWNPGNDQEFFSLDDLIKEFKIEKINKSGAVFNIQKLDWFNKYYIKKLNLDDLIKYARPFLVSEGLIEQDFSEEKFGKILELERDKIKTLAELPEAVRFIFALPDYETNMLIWKDGDLEDVRKNLMGIKELLISVKDGDWQIKQIETFIKEWILKNGLENGNVLWPLRVSLSGQKNSPSPFGILAVLEKDEVFRRIDVAIDKISGLS